MIPTGFHIKLQEVIANEKESSGSASDACDAA